MSGTAPSTEPRAALRVCVTGASGQVGRALLASAPPGVHLQALKHTDLDISDAAAVLAAIEAAQPDLIINAAAYTAVDQAEAQPQRAHAVNAQGARNLALAAGARPACRLLHISTDYVFDGTAAGSYRPGDATRPLGVYGRTKLQGEQAVLELLPERGTVVRTAWVYSAQGRNFVLTMLRIMRERGSVRVVCDQVGCPTAAGSVATVLWRLAVIPQARGIYHWTDAGQISWYEFARAIAEEALALGLIAQAPQVTPISSADYQAAAPRPRRSALDLSDTAQRLALQPVPWRVNLRRTLQSLTEARAP